MKSLLTTIALIIAGPALAGPADDPQQPPQECKSLADFAKDLTKHGAPGQFVRMTHDQTIWARGYYVGSPPFGSPDPGTEESFFWSLGMGAGVVAFSRNGVTCYSILMSPTDARALLNQGA